MANETVTNEVTSMQDRVSEQFGMVSENATKVGSAFTEAGKAYFTGVYDLGKALFGYGREALDETVEHAKVTVQAKNLKEVAELQAAFMQTRVENSAAHAKEFVDLARVKTEESLKPVVELLDNNKAA